ncbi:MAG: hypothetical protein GY716_20145 [bacterium]|nr:hypothetical protein [bacterium]
MSLRQGFLILWLLLSCSGSVLEARPGNQEVGAFLVFPSVQTETFPGSGVPVETWLTIANAPSAAPGTGGGSMNIRARINFIDGTTCQACTFTVPISPDDSEIVVVQRDGMSTELRVLRTNQTRSCPAERGFVTVSIENDLGETLRENVLLGEQRIVDYTNGRSFTTEALALHASGGGNSDRDYAFDDVEYSRLSRFVAFDFVAPNAIAPTAFDAYLTLFTLGFVDGVSPITDCSITAFDDESNSFSDSVMFGCWTQVELGSLTPEFNYPDLGVPTEAESGWIQLDCQVDTDANLTPDANGAVHGVISQWAPLGTVLFGRPGGATLSLTSPAAWGRLGKQSVTTGDAVTLELE